MSFTPLIAVNISVSLYCGFSQLPFVQSWLVWNHKQIIAGEWWRLVTGNFTHTNFAHLAMNLSALWLASIIFVPKTKTLLLLLFMSSLLIGLSLLFSSIHTYLGLSGVLHALFAYYGLKECLERRKSGLLLMLGLLLKLASEQYSGASASIAQLINARVAIEAHLIGAVVGIMLLVISLLFNAKYTRST